MNEENKNIYREEDEIDIYKLLLVIKKRAGLIIGLFIIAVFFAGTAAYLTKPVYRASFIIKTAVISPGETVSLIKKLGDLREEGRIKELSQLSNMDDEKLENIVSLQAKPQKGEERNVEVTVDVTAPSIVTEIGENIVRYLNRDSHVTESISIKMENLNNLRNEIQKKVYGLEDIKNAVIAQIRHGKAIGFNPLSMDKDIIELQKKLWDTEMEIKQVRGFEVIVEPNIPKQPIKPEKRSNIALAGITALFSGILLSFFLEWVEKKRLTVR